MVCVCGFWLTFASWVFLCLFICFPFPTLKNGLFGLCLPLQTVTNPFFNLPSTEGRDNRARRCNITKRPPPITKLNSPNIFCCNWQWPHYVIKSFRTFVCNEKNLMACRINPLSSTPICHHGVSLAFLHISWWEFQPPQQKDSPLHPRRHPSQPLVNPHAPPPPPRATSPATFNQNKKIGLLLLLLLLLLEQPPPPKRQSKGEPPVYTWQKQVFAMKRGDKMGCARSTAEEDPQMKESHYTVGKQINVKWIPPQYPVACAFAFMSIKNRDKLCYFAFMLTCEL